MLKFLGYTWALFGIAAIVTACLNVVWTIKRKDAKWFRFSSLSLTALTLCAFHSQTERWVEIGDWAALQDVTIGMSGALWFLTIASILINGISLFKNSNR